MKAKLFYLPDLFGDSILGHQKEPARLPLISLPIIKSFLESYGAKVELDDLGIKVFHDNKNSKDLKKKVDMSVFTDRQRIARFIKTGNDDQLEETGHRILKKTKYKHIDVVGFSFVDCWTFEPMGAAIVLSKIIKEETGSLIILGGSRFEKTIGTIPLKQIPFIDIFWFRSNHLQIARLLYAFQKGIVPKDVLFEDTIFNEKRIRKFLDIIDRSKSGIRKPPMTYHTKEVLLPLPNFDGLPLDLYRFIPRDVKENKLSNKKILILPYYFTWGCPNNCIFCKDSFTDKFIVKKPEDVAQDLKHLSRKYNTKQFMFMNTCVNPTKIYARQLADQIIKQDLDLKWFDCATFKHLDKPLLEKLQRAGATRLLYGLECASPKMQKYLEKNIDLIQASAMLKYADKLNIWNELELISGLPHENEQDRKLTVQFIEKNRKYLDYFYITKFYLIPSKLTKYPSRYGIKNIQDKKDDSCEGLAFDEINGLTWAKKKKQLQSSFNMYFNLRKKLNNQFDNSNIHFYKIFYLYSIFDSKKEIREYIKKHGHEIN